MDEGVEGNGAEVEGGVNLEVGDEAEVEEGGMGGIITRRITDSSMRVAMGMLT